MLSVLVFKFLLLLCISFVSQFFVTNAQYLEIPQIACPNYFKYLNADGTYIGQLTLPNIQSGASTVEVQFSQRYPVQSNYYGSLNLYYDQATTLSNLQRGIPITYRVDFPLINEVPKLTQIAVNGRVICSASPYSAPSTSLKLQHTLRTTVGSSAVRTYDANRYSYKDNYIQEDYPKEFESFFTNAFTSPTQNTVSLSDSPGGYYTQQSITFRAHSNSPQRIQTTRVQPQQHHQHHLVPQTQRQQQPQRQQQSQRQHQHQPQRQQQQQQQPQQQRPQTRLTTRPKTPGQQPQQQIQPQPQKELPQPKQQLAEPQQQLPEPQQQLPEPQQQLPEPQQQLQQPEQSQPQPQQQPQQPFQTPSEAASQSFEAICGKEGSPSNNFSPFIYGGKPLRRGEYPWLTAIYRKSTTSTRFICGGSLISSSLVLSAAHCFEGLTANRISVTLGRYNLSNSNEPVVSRDIQTLIVHPEYATTSGDRFPDADLALLQMSAYVSFSRSISPICLWTESAEELLIVGTSAMVAGWGFRENNYVSPIPHKAEADIVSDRDCLTSSAVFQRITSERTFCAGNRDGRGPCKGDSGGGLMVQRNNRWTLRGVVSAGQTEALGCNLREYVVYCDIAKHMPWMQSYLRS